VKTVALLFNWPHRHRIHLLLPAMLILAALAHCGIFFLFSVANPQVKSDGLNPARVYFLGEASPELAKLESTLTSNDPALFAPRHSTAASIAFCANYTPQFASSRTALLNLPPRTRKPTSPPPATGPVIIPTSRQPSPTLPQNTFHRLSSPDLADRLPQAPVENFFPKSTAGSLDTATFLLAYELMDLWLIFLQMSPPATPLSIYKPFRL
jgi:hypothetical protein